jgi:hypothetical protein
MHMNQSQSRILDMGYGKTKQELGQEQKILILDGSVCRVRGRGVRGRNFFLFVTRTRENTKEPMFVFTGDDEELTLVWWD